MNPKDNYQFRLGEIVLIVCDDKKRLEWPMARIIELIKGTDGIIRVAKVKTAGGTLTRPLQRLIPLEIGDVEDIPANAETKGRAKEMSEVKIVEPVVKGRTRVKKKAKKVVRAEEDTSELSERVTRYGRKVKRPVRFN